MARITAPVWTLAQCIRAFSPMGKQSHLGKTMACVAGSRSMQSKRTFYRFDFGESTSACCWGSKKNGSWQALGRSRGGLNTKIHALSSNDNALLRICLTGGEVHDSQAFEAVYCHLQQMTNVESVSADRAYDSDAIRNSIHHQGHQCVIPPKSNRRELIAFDRQKYKNRNCIEQTFRNLKNFRRIATRYDKLAATFKAFIYFASSLLFAKFVNTP
jgi:transposase